MKYVSFIYTLITSLMLWAQFRKESFQLQLREELPITNDVLKFKKLFEFQSSWVAINKQTNKQTKKHKKENKNKNKHKPKNKGNQKYQVIISNYDFKYPAISKFTVF